jgi:non-specific serine/threonine protein kinase
MPRTEDDLARAEPVLEEALELLGPDGDPEAVASVLINLGHVARRRGEYGAARRLLEDSLARFRAIGASLRVGWTLECLSRVALQEEDRPLAQRQLEEARALLDAVGDRKLLRRGLWIAGVLAVLRGEHAHGVRLLGAGARDPVVRASLHPDERQDWGTSLEAARAALGEEAFGRAWADGQAMPLEQAVANGGAAAPPAPIGPPPAPPAPPGRPDPEVDPAAPLSPREREVAALVARGCSNREVAERLVIAQRTAEAHVTHILTKLALRSRAQLVVWAMEHGVLAGARG